VLALIAADCGDFTAAQNFLVIPESYDLKGVTMFTRKQKFPVGKVAVGFGLGAVSGAMLALL
jgi:hypothetical protein